MAKHLETLGILFVGVSFVGSIYIVVWAALQLGWGTIPLIAALFFLRIYLGPAR